MTDEIKTTPSDEVVDCGCEEELGDIVEFTDDSGRIMKFYHISTIEHSEKFYAFFTAAEEIEGVAPDEIFIYEIAGEPGNEELLPIEDDKLLDEVYADFCSMMDENDESCCDDDDCDCGCHHHDD